MTSRLGMLLGAERLGSMWVPFFLAEGVVVLKLVVLGDSGVGPCYGFWNA